MLSSDIRFTGFSHSDWTRLLQVFEPKRSLGKARDASRPRGLVIAVHRGGRLIKLIHSRVGRLRLDDLAPDWPISSCELARRHDASWALVIEHGALDRVMDGLGQRLRREHHLTTQILTLLSLVSEQTKLGGIAMWPRRLDGLPAPSESMLERTLDAVIPVGKAMLIGLFDGGDLYTSVALLRGTRGIEAVLGPTALRGELGLLSGDFRRDYRHVASAVTDRLGPLSLGCFAQYQTFRELEVDPRPGAWAKAVAVRDIVLHPVPAAMAVPLGVDAGRAAFSVLRQFAARVDPAGVLSPALNAVFDAALGGRNVERMLGFNPLELLQKLLSRDT